MAKIRPYVTSHTSTTIQRDLSRLSWVMVLRVVIISVLLGATIMMNRDTPRMLDSSTRFLLSLIVSTYVLTIAYAIWYRIGRRLILLGYIQVFSDALLFAALSYATGGVTSGFTFLFHLWVIVAVVSMGKRAGFIQATVSAALIGLIVVLMELKVLVPLSDVASSQDGIGTTLYALSVNIISLYIVAFLVNVLAARLESAGEGLQKEREQKEELARKLEQAKRLAALGELAATLAHEIRNPLSAVSGSFQMLKSGVQLGDEDAILALIIERELERMGRLVEDILEFARPRAAELSPLNLSLLVAETSQLFASSSRQRGIDFELNIGEEIHCTGDANQLRQVLWNLLVNASQVVSDDTGRIHVSLKSEAQWVYLDVTDNGPGVSREIRNKIFDAFFSTRERGMGLGLALCKRIMTDHGGQVDVLDTEDSGATFRLTLPKNAATAAKMIDGK